MQHSSIPYYNKHAQDFFDTTINIDLSELYKLFLSHLSKGAKILDAGCGSGRDSKYFVSQGYEVEAFDGSKELVKLAREFTNLPVQHKFFSDVCEKDVFDGIWAAASLLHLPKNELISVLAKLKAALNPKGIWFMSFRYGEGEHNEGDRCFYDQTEISLTKTLNDLGGLSILDLWIPETSRSRRGFRFLCCIVKRN